MNENLNNICTCGHIRSKHKALRIEPHQIDRLSKVVFFCATWKGIFSGTRCYCIDFKLDNLKYLEELYEYNNRSKD